MRLSITSCNNLVLKPVICSYSNTHNIAISLVVVVRVVFTIVLQLVNIWAKEIIKLHRYIILPCLNASQDFNIKVSLLCFEIEIQWKQMRFQRQQSRGGQADYGTTYLAELFQR